MSTHLGRALGNQRLYPEVRPEKRCAFLGRLSAGVVSLWKSGHQVCPIIPTHVRDHHLQQVYGSEFRYRTLQELGSKVHQSIYLCSRGGALLVLLSDCAFLLVCEWSRLPFHSPLNICSGVTMRNSGNKSSAPCKSFTLLLIMTSALPAKASSIKKLSPSSLRFGLHKKYTDIHWQTEYKLLSSSRISWGFNGHLSRIRFLLLTSSYSENKALLINGLYSPFKLRRRISLLGPSSPIRALIKTLVSITIVIAIGKMIAYTPSLTSAANDTLQRTSR